MPACTISRRKVCKNEESLSRVGGCAASGRGRPLLRPGRLNGELGKAVLAGGFAFVRTEACPVGLRRGDPPPGPPTWEWLLRLIEICVTQN